MMSEKQYINYDGYWIKIFPGNQYGEILNTQNEAIISGKDENDLRRTLSQGIEKFIKQYGTPELYNAISVQNLIAELSLSMTNPTMPCCLKDGTPITGVYIEDGIVKIDTDNQRKKEIMKICKEV